LPRNYQFELNRWRSQPIRASNFIRRKVKTYFAPVKARRKVKTYFAPVKARRKVHPYFAPEQHI
jgi:hypothetical protein